MTAYFTSDFAEMFDDTGNMTVLLDPGTIVDSVGDERPDAIKVQDRIDPLAVGWVAREHLTLETALTPVAPDLDVPRFVEAAQDAANTVNRAFPADEVELSSTLLLVFAWIESQWENAGADVPVPTGAQPGTKFGPFGFGPDRWAATIARPKYATILRGVTDFSRIDPCLQCYVAACLVNELQLALHTVTGSAPSSTLIWISFLVGAEQGGRFARLAPDDKVDAMVGGQAALTDEALASHGDLFSSGGIARTRKEVEAIVEGRLREAAQAAAQKAAEFAKSLDTLADDALGDPKLGALSRKYEVGDRGAATVSSGIGDPGGVSYGSYQMTSRPNGGRVAEFVNDPAFRWGDRFDRLVPGSQEFTAAWKVLVKEEPKDFPAAQHDFIKRTHFDVLVEAIKSKDKLDVLQRSQALQDVVWSTAVHHGPHTLVVHRAIEKLGGSQTLADPLRDRALIRAIYAERGKRNTEGKLAYFKSSSDDVQQSIADRFVNEERDALEMFDRMA